MWGLLAVVGICELLHMSVIVPKLDGDWGDWKPGNYGLDPLNLATPYRFESELKNGTPCGSNEVERMVALLSAIGADFVHSTPTTGRLAMIAFGGLVTQAALGHPPPY